LQVVSSIEALKPEYLYAFIISPMRATCPVRIPLDLIILTVFGEGTRHEAPDFTVCRFLPP